MRTRVALALGSVFLAVFLCGWLVGARGAAAGTLRAPAVRPQRAARVIWVRVRPGDSLWALGRRYAPAGIDLRAWIYRVERANGLRGSALVPGERLALPAS